MRSAAFTEYLEEHGARFEEWRGAQLVSDFGDAHAEYRSVRFGGLGIADRSERETIVGYGADVVKLIQGLVTGDVYQLVDEGSGQINTAVNVKGRLVTDLRILHVPDLLVIDLEPGQIEAGALRHFKRNIINEDAKLVDRSAVTARILVAGERAIETLSSVAVKLAAPFARVEAYGATWGQVRGHDVIFQRTPLTGGDAFELYLEIDAEREVWEALFEADSEAVPIGNTALEMLRVEAGVPRFGVELDEKIIPLEADMNYAVAYNKGCYLGQEIIARLDTLGTPAKMLRALVLEGEELPEIGAEIRSDDKKIGDVRAAIFSDVLKRPLVHAYLKRNFNEPGRIVRIGDTEGEVRELGVL